MAKPPKKPQKAKKDPARPTRAKASRPDSAVTPDALADLLNPAINKGTAGLGSGTGQNSGLQPPLDNSWDRRADFSNAHKARKSAQGFEEAPQAEFDGPPVSGLDPKLADELGLSDEAKYRLPRADLPTQPGGFAGFASQQSLDKLLREGRPEFASAAGDAKVWTPHRPPRPEKSEGGQKFVIKSDFEPQGRPADTRSRIWSRASSAATARRCCSASPARARPSPWPRSSSATQRPALILAPNKTLAAQLYGEFKSFFPDNAVEYFVSYYDYYQPEAYVPRTDTYIEKESSINEQIDRMRHSATRALLERDDVIIVASVSCIYGIGSVETYSAMTFTLKQGGASRSASCSPTSSRCNTSARRPTSTAARSACAATPSTSSRRTTRTAPGACICSATRSRTIEEFDPLTGQKTDELDLVKIYANSHYVTPRPTLQQAISQHQGRAARPPRPAQRRRPPARSAAARAAHRLSTSK